VAEIKRSNKTWMQEQLVNIDNAIREAKVTTDKYCAEGIETLRDTSKEQVAKLSAEEIKKAKETLSGFAGKTTEYTESIRINTVRCDELLHQLQTWETKYGATGKEMEANKSVHNKYQAKVDKMEQDMDAMRQTMTEFTRQAEENLRVVGEISQFATAVTDNRTDIEATVEDCKKSFAEAVKKMESQAQLIEAKKADMSREYKTIESICKQIFESEDNRRV
jgi:chromosome segregation ATPase